MSPTSVRCRPATSPAEVLEAWTLVHDVYVEHGHIEPEPASLYLAAGALHPATEVYNGYQKGRLVATLTVIPDSELGLPPDSGFPDELARLRQAGDPLVFCGQFVSALPRPDDSTAILSERATLTLQLFAIVVRRARDQHRGGRQRIVANPVRQHVRYYERFLGFEQLGPIRTHGRYHVASALMVTDWNRLQAAPQLPAALRQALHRRDELVPPPVGTTTATLADPRMRAYVDATWGPHAPVWTHAEKRIT